MKRISQLKSFEDVLETLPTIIIDKYNEGKNSPERLDYHPEGNLGEHIKICTERALTTQDANLICTAVLHDICKYENSIPRRNGKLPKKWGLIEYEYNGEYFTYWSNPTHDIQSYIFISNNVEVQDWINKMGGCIDVVKRLCKLHMKFKFIGNMKAKKYLSFKNDNIDIWQYLIEFKKIDTMFNDYYNNRSTLYTYEDMLSNIMGNDLYDTLYYNTSTLSLYELFNAKLKYYFDSSHKEIAILYFSLFKMLNKKTFLQLFMDFKNEKINDAKMENIFFKIHKSTRVYDIYEDINIYNKGQDFKGILESILRKIKKESSRTSVVG